MWRLKGDDQYKISEAFLDEPLELSNYLLIRSREHLYLKNKSEGKLKAGSGVAGAAYKKLTKEYYN